jgi:hypothetical protein
VTDARMALVDRDGTADLVEAAAIIAGLVGEGSA